MLFNGALVRGAASCSLFREPRVLRSVLDHAIRPLAMALAHQPRLAMWEVVNEPEGLLDTSLRSDVADAIAPPLPPECLLTDRVALDCAGGANGPGWNADCTFSAVVLQRFVNRVVAALRAADSSHLVTLGAWSFCSSTHEPCEKRPSTPRGSRRCTMPHSHDVAA